MLQPPTWCEYLSSLEDQKLSLVKEGGSLGIKAPPPSSFVFGISGGWKVERGMWAKRVGCGPGWGRGSPSSSVCPHPPHITTRLPDQLRSPKTTPWTNSDRPQLKSTKAKNVPGRIAQNSKVPNQKISTLDRPKFKSTKPKNNLEVSNTDHPKLKNTKQRICFYYYIPLFRDSSWDRPKLKSTKYLPLQFLPAADMFSIQVGFAFEIMFSINGLIEIIVS